MIDNAYRFNSLAVQTLIGAIGVTALGIFSLFRAKLSHASVVFFILASSIGLWLYGYSRMYAALDENLALWWARAGQVGVACIPAAVYNFSALMIEDYEKSRLKVFVLWLVSAAFAVLMVATDFHFRTLYHYRWGYYPELRITSAFFLLYFFGSMLLALHNFLSAYRATTASLIQRKRARTLAIGFMIGYFGAVDFLPSLGISLYPFGYVPILLFTVIAAVSIFRYRFSTITPDIAARRVVETMKDGLIVVDGEGTIRMVNQAICRLLGYREQDLVGRRPAAGMIDSSAFARELEAIIPCGEFTDRELEYRHLSGPARTLSVSATVMHNLVGEPVASVCLFTDVTGRKRAENERENLIGQLKKANEKLQAVDMIKSEIISLVSHELRTPLTTIKAFIELMILKPEMPEQKKAKFMSVINAQTDRLKRLISDHLDLARIESGGMSWSTGPVSIREIVESSISGIKPLCESKGLSISVVYEASLPGLSGDRDRLVQVVTNILSNAVKFTPAGGAILIRVSREPAPVNQVVVAISDTGIGIPDNNLELIFEKFRRADDQSASAIEGTGLGLSLARDIVEHHGGRIWADSLQGRGSTFTFTLPVPEAKNSTGQTVVSHD